MRRTGLHSTARPSQKSSQTARPESITHADARSSPRLQVTLGIARADGVKCERCWCYSTDVDVSEDAEYYGVCKRCDTALSSMGFPAVGKWLPKPAEAEAEAAAV